MNDNFDQDDVGAGMDGSHHRGLRGRCATGQGDRMNDPSKRLAWAPDWRW